MSKLIGVGAALVDSLAYVPESFLQTIDGGKGGMELVDFPALQEIVQRLPEKPYRAPGGSAANTVMGAARLGSECAMLAKTGEDEAGTFYRGQFAEAGVDVSRFKTDSATPTGTCLSLITPDSQRTMRTFLGASATLEPTEIRVEDFQGCGHLHLEGYLLFNQDLMTRVLDCARQAGCRVSLDLGAPEVVQAAADTLPELLREKVDMVFANEDEAAAFCASGKDDLRTALEEMGQLCEVAAVKLGAEGSLIRRGGETVEVPALRVQAVDTTGAGDLWAAGFLHGLLRGESTRRAGDLGARLGAEAVKTTGAALSDEVYNQVKKDFNLQ